MTDYSATVNRFLDKIWDGVTEDYKWIRGVILGEWDDNRSLSQVVADAVVGFVPGLGSIVTLRDLIAVIFRLAKYPEKRKEVDEWILLVAMLVPLIITVLGLAAAGVGALVGAEAGGFLRAVALFLVKKGGVGLKVLVDFLHAHGYGSAIKALREIKFAKYEAALTKELARQIEKLQALLASLSERVARLHPEHWPSWLGRDAMLSVPEKVRHWTTALTELGQHAHDMIPKALIEMDQRLHALLAGNIKVATQTTHAISTGAAAPKVERAVDDAEHRVARNAGDPEPGNTRRIPERRVMALSGKREYGIVDEHGRPVGAKPYKAGDPLDNPPVRVEDWDDLYSPKVKEGYPNLAAGGREDFVNFSSMAPNLVVAGSKTTFKRVVGKGRPEMDNGTYYNRELPADGQDLRTNSAVKEEWNNDGEYIELRVPPKGHPAWQEIHAMREQRVGTDSRYSEELKFWEGPVASQKYEVTMDSGGKVADEWALSGGKQQQQFDYQELQVLKQHGFISQRKPTNFLDYDPNVNNIVPKKGPHFEVVPLDQALPHPKPGNTP
ncbi:MAG: hypothetical protein ACTS5I_03660 [Rhodanobacter sp.]